MESGPSQNSLEGSASPRSHDLERLSPRDVTVVGSELQAFTKASNSSQSVAERVVNYLYESFRIPETGEPACVLVRCFQTCSYAGLPLHYQDVADQLLERIPSHPKMRCLSLLATRGSRQVWNDVTTSLGHLCIPLPSVDVVNRAPMISRLLQQIGISVEQIVTLPETPGFLVEEPSHSASNMAEMDAEDGAQDSLNVFHVERALGSPFIPAQKDFVLPYGVHSVVGMGGRLSDGELFVVILFARVPISLEVARLFRSLAPGIRQSILRFGPGHIFKPASD